MNTKAKSILPLLLIWYLIGLVLAHTSIGHMPVIAISVIIVAFIIVTDNAVITKQYVLYYWILMIMLVIAAYGDVINTFTVVVAMAANILIYEQFAKLTLPKRKVQIMLYGIMISAISYAFTTSSWDRLYFGNRNSLPILLIFLIYVTDSYMKQNIITRRIVLIFTLVFGYLCKSRAGLLAIASYLLLRTFKRKGIQIIIFATIFICIVMAYVTGQLTLPNMKIYGRSVSYLSGRNALWDAALSIAKENPLGLGYGGYSEKFNTILGTGLSAHNLYLNVLLQYGWLYTGVYIAYFITLIKKASNPITVAAILSMYLRGFFEIGIPYGLSLGSAMLLLPFYMEKSMTKREDNKEILIRESKGVEIKHDRDNNISSSTTNN